ncbi:MAG: hypothetical protein IMZ61_10045 [Planctomycetes bacterium]|nr:hypothetical protein [Planctomycetota bacterium]
MTISTQTFRFPYVSTGASTLYPYTNKILDQNDLVVYVDDVLQVIGTNYTVTGVGVGGGGNVSFVVNPPAGDVVLITKDGVEFTQETDYVENDAFPAAAHEDALDKLTNIAQKIWDYTRRSVKLAITSTLTDLEFPTPEAGKSFAWNGAGTAIENVTLAGIGAISDTAYNSATWDGVTAIAPSKHAVRDELEVLIASIPAFATASDVLAGTPNLAVPPDQLSTAFSTNLTLTDQATVTWDTNLGVIATITLGGDRTMAAPANLKNGVYILHVIQDGVGTRLITWNAVFKWQVAVAPVLSTGINKHDILSFICDGTYLYGSYMLDVR